MDVAINIDGTGKCVANTPVHFLNHMLDVRAPSLLSTHTQALPRRSWPCIQRVDAHADLCGTRPRCAHGEPGVCACSKSRHTVCWTSK